MRNNNAKVPLPLPKNFRELRAWAEDLVAYLRQQDSVTGLLRPTPIVLEHRIKSNAKATVDGILMFNPTTQEVEVSSGGQWLGIINGRRVVTGTQAVANVGSAVVFATAFSAAPLVFATVAGDFADNEAVIPRVYGVTAAGFSVKTTMVDSAYSTPVRLTAATVSWLAIL